MNDPDASSIVVGVFFILGGLFGLWAAPRYDRPLTPRDIWWNKISPGSLSMAAYKRIQIISSAIFLIVGIFMLIFGPL